MPVREFDIFSGASMEMVNKIYDYVKNEFPKTVADQSNQLASAAYRLWAGMATSEEHGSTWGEKYASTLVWEPAKGGQTMARIYVDESHENIKFVYMMEKGVKTWSIRDALMEGKGLKRHMQKHHNNIGVPHVSVPFRHRVPGKTKPTSNFAGVMPEDVYQMAKEGTKLGLEYGKLAGLKRYSRGPHVGYFTFRTVTKESKGWMYPRKAPTPVYEKVLAKVETMVEHAIKGWIERLEKDLHKEFGK